MSENILILSIFMQKGPKIGGCQILVYEAISLVHCDTMYNFIGSLHTFSTYADGLMSARTYPLPELRDGCVQIDANLGMCSPGDVLQM